MKKVWLLTLALSALVTTGCLKQGVKAVAPKTEDEKTLKTLGQLDARRLKNFDLSDKELLIWFGGVQEGLKKKVDVNIQEFSKKIAALGDKRGKRVAEREKKSSAGYLDKMKKEAGATALESGVVYREIKAGTGDAPKADSMVKVHYHGTLVDGSVFDSSVKRGNPATFPLNRVIPCWTEAVQKMKVGGKAKVTCPSETAYGDRGAPPKINPGATLTFEVELLEIVKEDPKKKDEKKS